MSSPTQWIWVTGAHGFLGRNVAKLCTMRGSRVFGLGHGDWDRSNEDPRAFGIERWKGGDVSRDSLRTVLAETGRPAAIHHCAGSGSVPFSVRSPRLDYEKTVSSTSELLDFVGRECPEVTVVYPSSGSVYGMNSDISISEDAPLRPVSPYGTHKVAAEKLLGDFSARFGIRTAVVRFFSIYGNGLRKQLFWDACQKWANRPKSNSVIEFSGSGQEVRDWIHVDDAVALMIEATRQATLSCPIVNGGSGVGTSVKTALETLFHALDDGSSSIRFTGEAREGDPSRFIANIAAARKWGWTPKVDLARGIREYAHWFRSEVP